MLLSINGISEDIEFRNVRHKENSEFIYFDVLKVPDKV
jgi:hypothetical protein